MGLILSPPKWELIGIIVLYFGGNTTRTHRLCCLQPHQVVSISPTCTPCHNVRLSNAQFCHKVIDKIDYLSLLSERWEGSAMMALLPLPLAQVAAT
eukprot:COSAG01_NODE_90_length_27307_cov_734.166458_23_plen_96_part_00